MTVVSRAARVRWLIVAVVVATLVAIPVVLANRPARAAAMPVDTLFRKVLAATHQPYQGFTVTTGAAGLPTLPTLGSVISLLDGETSQRVWFAAPDRWRVDTLSPDGERDLFQAPAGQTIWDSASNQLTTITGGEPVARFPRGPDLIPPVLAQRLLRDGEAADRHTALPSQRVAGVVAAGFRVTPADQDTTVVAIDVWADPATGLPLRVEVTTRGTTQPVLVSRFLDIDLTAPAAGVVAVPTAPHGAGAGTLSSQDVTDTLRNLRTAPLPDTLDGHARVGMPDQTVRGLAAYGDGLSRFIAISLPSDFAFDWYRAATSAGATIVRYGGADTATMSTPLLSVLIVLGPFGFGIAFAGPVTTDVLTGAAHDLISMIRTPA